MDLKNEKELIQTEEIHFINAKSNYRYERKFTVPSAYSIKEVVHTIKSNSFLFREIFHLRQVNNIYFDTLGYNDYQDNVLGVSERKKIRIRWYGDTFGEILKPVLEIKIKKGLVGDKWSYNLKPFTFDNTTTQKSLLEVFKESGLPKPILESVKMGHPTLLNSYKRRYFLSANTDFRVTLDFDLLYHEIESLHNRFNKKPVKDANKIVELKYNLENDKFANAVTTQFPFRLNKNSKYINGVNAIKQFPQ